MVKHAWVEVGCSEAWIIVQLTMQDAPQHSVLPLPNELFMSAHLKQSTHIDKVVEMPTSRCHAREALDLLGTNVNEDT